MCAQAKAGTRLPRKHVRARGPLHRESRLRGLETWALAGVGADQDRRSLGLTESEVRDGRLSRCRMILRKRSISRRALFNDVSRASLHRCTRGMIKEKHWRGQRDQRGTANSFPKISFAVPGVGSPVLAHSSRSALEDARMASHRSHLGRTEAVPCVCQH